MNRTEYEVTITPKFPRWNYQSWTVRVVAENKTQANKRARRDLESEGHIFTHSDAATFSAADVTQETE